MARLAQTEDLTEIQSEILTAVREFVDKEIIPVAQELEHADEYPTDIVEKMKEMGLFGCIIREEYGGLGLTASTYAKVVERISRVRVSPPASCAAGWRLPSRTAAPTCRRSAPRHGATATTT